MGRSDRGTVRKRLGLCTQLEAEYAGKGYPWIGRTRRVLMDPPKGIVRRLKDPRNVKKGVGGVP